jgi:FixJ family two-component response regulator
MSTDHEVRSRGWRVALVDDDTDSLRALARLLSSHGYEVSSYSSSAEFFESLAHNRPEILIADLRMPELDGLTLQAAMREQSLRIPTIFLSGYADVATSVRAIQMGAIDMLEKPCDGRELLAALERAADVAEREREVTAIASDLRERWATLTPREQEVGRWVVTGRLNKQIAAALGTTEKTVKVHRSRVMLKMHADSVAALVRMLDLLGERVEKPTSASSSQHQLELGAIRQTDLPSSP